MYQFLDYKRDEFRLLYIQPAVTESSSLQRKPLIAKLYTYSLSDAPSFTALSYCWGQILPKTTLIVNGNAHECSMNAEIALRHLQKRTGIYVWIDQLCINQSDDIEKNHQVRMMQRIYMAATRVAAWLGPSADDSDIFIPHVCAMASLIRNNQILDLIRNYTEAGFLQRMIQAFRSFLQREYWTRLWIIQEFAIPQQLLVCCGESSIVYEDLRHYLNFLGQIYVHWSVVQGQSDAAVTETFGKMMHGFFRPPEYSYLAGVFTRRRRYQMRLNPSFQDGASSTVKTVEDALLKGGESLFAVLSTTHVLEFDYNHTQVTDPRDRIFAVMHFADDINEFPSLPDYNVSCERLYQSVAQHILEQGHIDMLSYCQFPQETPMATWAPDWRIGLKRPNNGTPWFTEFNASMSVDHDQLVESLNSECISLRGMLVDRVARAGNVWNPHWLRPLDRTAALTYIDEVRDLCAESPLLRNSIKDQESTDIMRICIADRYHYKEIERQPELVQGFRDAVTKMKNSTSDDNSGRTTSSQETIEIGWDEPWYMFAMKNLHARRPFISTSGRVGLAPTHVEENDILVIFLGAKFPYVLRRTNNTHKLIGEAYVHGIMYGESLTKGFDIEDFLLV